MHYDQKYGQCIRVYFRTKIINFIFQRFKNTCLIKMKKDKMSCTGIRMHMSVLILGLFAWGATVFMTRKHSSYGRPVGC